jgi:putative ABC transport system permease protein
MNVLAWKDIRFNFLRFALSALSVGFLITGAIGIAGLYRGIVRDALLTIDTIGADLWIVQGGHVGPFADGSVVSHLLDRRVEGIPGVGMARRFLQINQQISVSGKETRLAITGLDFPKDRGDWLKLTSGRLMSTHRGELIADERSGLILGSVIRLGRDDFTVVGTTRDIVDMSGDPMVFVSIPDALDIADTRPSEAVLLDRAQAAIVNPDRPTRISAVVATLEPGADLASVRAKMSRWGDVNVLTAEDQRRILLDGRLWRLRMQILFFLVLLLAVTGIVVGMTIYSATIEKLHQIAMLKLLGARDRFILSMIVEQALLIGLFAFIAGLALSKVVFPNFPRRIEMLSGDLVAMFAGVVVICVIGSWFGIARALKVRAQEVLA